MPWKIKHIIILWLIMASCRQEAEPVVLKYYNEEALIEVAELQEIIGSDSVKIIDFRRMADFNAGHIPNSIPVWRSDIEDQQFPGKGLMAAKEAVEQLLSELGVGQNDQLILYDDQANCDAARLWWVLKVYGFNRVRLLNGGLHAWQAAGGKTTDIYIRLQARDFHFEGPSNPDLLINKEEVTTILGDENWAILDARTADEYYGKRQKKGAARAGRIPGSLHLDWASTVDYHGNKTFKRPEELQKIYGGLKTKTSIVAYCHSGVRSAHTSFVLSELLGYRQVRNYDGSWLEWSADPSALVTLDSITTIFQ
ncbi:sulfurtransferase [Robiginitalea sp. IMCC43444]|uniref:sulfurtransferase n=1 Tax=Robiginitalea sp. IMCC43444 TaxID=3459121 RepID=UPI00404352A4